MKSKVIQNLIIGAGPAGLAAAALLRNANLPFTILEQSQHVGNAWHNHYDRLHLHTVKELSHLPLMPFPDEYPRYVSRQQLVDYMENYAKHFDIKPEFGIEVVKISNGADWQSANNGGDEPTPHWIVTTKNGKNYQAQNIILATGKNRIPHQPTWQGQEEFQGKIIHSRFYKNTKPYESQKILVVGMGNTGAEIALDLAENGVEVSIALRGTIALVPRDLNGRPVQLTAKQLEKLPFGLGDWLGSKIRRIYYGDLSKYGLKITHEPPAKLLRETGKTPMIDLGTIAKIKEGKIKVMGDLSHFTKHGVTFKNGEEQQYDCVILATGYRTKLEDLVEKGTDLIDEFDGRRTPIGTGFHKGLYFVGFDNYKTGGILGTIFQDSKTVVERIKSSP